MDTKQEPAHTPINIIYISLSLPLSLTAQLDSCRSQMTCEQSTQLKVRGQFWLDKTSQSENREIAGIPTDFDYVSDYKKPNCNSEKSYEGKERNNKSRRPKWSQAQGKVQRQQIH